MIDDFDIDISADDLLDDIDIDLDDIDPSSSSSSGTKSSPEEMAPARDSYDILVIDDDKWIQRIFNQYINSWGFNHIPASNAFEGLDMAIKTKPLAIFLDIIMPDVPGDVTLKFLKNIEAIKDIPVVIISGNLNKEVLKNTYKDGATGFISKPFTKDILLQKVMEILPNSVISRMENDGKLANEAVRMG